MVQCINDIRNTEEAAWVSQYSQGLSFWPRPYAKGCIVAWVVVLRCFFFYYPTIYSCNYNARVFISWQDGSIATGILSTLNTPLSSLPVSSKLGLYCMTCNTIPIYTAWCDSIREYITSLIPSVSSSHVRMSDWVEKDYISHGTWK